MRVQQYASGGKVTLGAWSPPTVVHCSASGAHACLTDYIRITLEIDNTFDHLRSLHQEPSSYDFCRFLK